MEPDCAEHLSTKSLDDVDVEPLVILLGFDRSASKNGESEDKTEDSNESEHLNQSENVEEKLNEGTEKIPLESDKSVETKLTNDDDEQVTDQVGLSQNIQNLSSGSTFSFPSKSLGRVSTHRKITCERLKELKIMVDKAVKENKTFCIHGTCPAIRNALRQRGWMEKRWRESRSMVTFHNAVKRSRKARSTNDVALMRSASRSSCYSASATPCDMSDAAAPKAGYCSISLAEEEDNIISRMLRNIEPALVWSARADTFEWGLIPKHQTINRFPRTSFATKVGLCNYLQHMHWFYEAGISDTLFPRCYCVCLPEEMQAFREDFRLTACLSLLKWLVYNYEKPSEKASDPRGEAVVQSSSGKVPLSAVVFAIQRIKEHVLSCQHGDIDFPPPFISNNRHNGRSLPYKTWDHQWDQFLTWFYQITHDGALLSSASANDTCDKVPSTESPEPELTVKDLYERAKTCLDEIRPYWPQMELDGMMDMWILKPGAKSRGRGIQLINRLEMVNQRLTPAVIKETRYVIQKYIERPLLIYKTKFDIRQWFLVTNSYPLTIWMYKESYLRFSSQVFSLHKLHESIHLCNNAIQCRYTNGNDRDPALPEDNMWDCFTFQTYLRTIGHASIWDDCIYPGMKESIIGALLASQDNMTDVSLATNITGPNPVRHKSSISFNQRIGTRMGSYFELFGADFMLTEDYRPWLIEINSCPCMASSTSVTARMCPQVLEDVIKVVIDRREKKEADTGMFELAYKQHVEPPPPYTGVCLSIQGKHIQRSSKNEVAASGGLEPGDKHYLDSGRGSTKDQLQIDEDEHSNYASSTDPECFVSEEELEVKGQLDEEGCKAEEDESQEKLSINCVENEEVPIETAGEDTPNVTSFEPLKTFVIPGGNGLDARSKSNLSKELDARESCEEILKVKHSPSIIHRNAREDGSGSESDLSTSVCSEFKTKNDILNSLQLFQEWRKSVLHTQETCRGVLSQLKSFKKWHMQCGEDFRVRPQISEQGKPRKIKSSEKGRSKSKPKWRKSVHKKSYGVPKSDILCKHIQNNSGVSNGKTYVSRGSSGKGERREVVSKPLREKEKYISTSPKPRKEVNAVAKDLSTQSSDVVCKEQHEEDRKKSWDPLVANISSRNKSLDSSGEMSVGDTKTFERQRNFLDHIAALNRKKECRNCLVTSSYDEMKKKAGFRPIEVVTFEPPFS